MLKSLYPEHHHCSHSVNLSDSLRPSKLKVCFWGLNVPFWSIPFGIVSDESDFFDFVNNSPSSRVKKSVTVVLLDLKDITTWYVGATLWSPPRSTEDCVFRFTLLWFKNMATWPTGGVTLLAPYVKVYFFRTCLCSLRGRGYVRPLIIAFCVLTFVLVWFQDMATITWPGARPVNRQRSEARRSWSVRSNTLTESGPSTSSSGVSRVSRFPSSSSSTGTRRT